MLESDVMLPEETSAKALLAKPLHLLTEDDIAQLTREDCRRYLKEKGMRRPSWNKSQAIQQVIVLKALLETTPGSDVGSRKKLRSSRPNNNTPESVPEGTWDNGEDSALAEETALRLRKDANKPDYSHGLFDRFPPANDASAQPRTTGLTNMPVGQMTIFYCGKVNVYEDVPADKAQAIMHIAASPLEFPQEQPFDGTMILQPSSHLSKPDISRSPTATAVLWPSLQTVRTSDNPQSLGEESNTIREVIPVQGPSTRKASVQRYLEKRKDRFKSKRKAELTSCASLEMYFNHQIGYQMLSKSYTHSPNRIRSPSTTARCSSVDDDSVKNVCLSTAVNHKGS